MDLLRAASFPAGRRLAAKKPDDEALRKQGFFSVRKVKVLKEPQAAALILWLAGAYGRQAPREAPKRRKRALRKYDRDR